MRQSQSRLVSAMAAAALLSGWAAPALARDEPDNRAAALQPVQPAPIPANPGLSDALGAIRAAQWDRARAIIDAMRDRQFAAFARAELFVAAGSPRVDSDAVAALLAQAPDLPQAAQLARLAQGRGSTALPVLPNAQRLAWSGDLSRRGQPRSVSDPALGDLPRAMQAQISADNPAAAEALFVAAEANLSPEAATEWRARIAWSYYIENDDTNARRLAAIAQSGAGDWVAHADWTQGLASWRENDCAAAMSAFRNVAGRARDVESQSAGDFWFARAATACGQPHEAQPALRRAAILDETFYGLLAAEVLGLQPHAAQHGRDDQSAQRIANLANVRIATALAAAGETALADEVLRHQARIGAPQDHAALLAITARLNLPETQLYLAYNIPSGAQASSTSRFPAPAWAPASGWRINPALIFAHALQESRFRTRVVSPAGAVGLMQVRPGTAGDMGLRALGGDLTNPAVNMAVGQSYIEYLRDTPVTGGLLPKVIAAYNAGPTPVARWNTEIRDNGDPLLFIESIPYWETRAYVGIVLRNLWVYEQELGTPSDSRAMLAQGRWPRVPAADTAVRIADAGSGFGANRR